MESTLDSNERPRDSKTKHRPRWYDNGTIDSFGGPERASRVNRGSPKQTARTSTEEVTQREAFPSTSSESSSARELASEKFFFWILDAGLKVPADLFDIMRSAFRPIFQDSLVARTLTALCGKCIYHCVLFSKQ